MGKRTPTPQYMPVSINGGLQTKSDPAQVRPPVTLAQNNFSSFVSGALSPRAGFTAMPALGNQDQALVGATNDELLACDAGGLYNYNTQANQWGRRGDYTDLALSVKNIVNQAVNQSYTQNQVGGVRNLTCDFVGDVGIAVWDTGVNTATGTNVTGGTVYICCFSGITGKPYWIVTTKGWVAPYPASTYAVDGFSTPTSVTPGLPTGATQPLVVAYKGNFILGMITCSNGSTNPLYGGAYMYQTNVLMLVPDGVTGVPPKPIIGPTTLTNATQVFGAAGTGVPVPVTLVQSGTTLSSGGYASFENTNHYFDITTNGTYLCVAASFVTVNGSNTPQFPARLWAAVTSASNPTSASAWTYNYTTTLPANVGGAAALPVIVASYPGCSYFGVATQWGVYSVAASNAQWSAPANYTGLQDNLNALYGLRSWPAGVGIIGTTNAYTMTVTNGYLTNTFSVNQLTIGSAVLSYVNVPMTGTRQLPQPGGGQSPVASRIAYLPSATAPQGSGVLDPCVWLYSASPAQKAGGSGFDAFINMYCVRINTAPYVINDPAQTSEVIARAFYLRAMPLRYGTTRGANYVSYSGGYTTAALVLGNVADNIAAIKTINVRGSVQTRSIIPLPQGALLTGADTRYYDGLLVRSAGWLRLPELSGSFIVNFGPGGTLVTSTVYTYYFVYVEYDAYGNAMYSSPSPPYSWNTGGNQTIRIETLDLWPATTAGNAMPAAIHIYRNTSTNPLQFYRLAVLTEPQTFQSGATYYYDTGPDDISGNPLLYSPPSGGELANDPAPPSTCAVATKQRVYVAAADAPTYLYPSKPFYAGRAPVEFNAAQYVDIDPSTGPIVGLSNLDDTVVIFKQRAIYLLSGDGPDATGVGQFNKPYRLNVDIGCKDPQSIVSSRVGVFFRSQRGIELLDRGGASVNYVGQAVEGNLNTSGWATITSASIVPTLSQVRFSNGNTDCLVYDYVMQTWTRYLILAGGSKMSMTFFGGNLYIGGGNGSTSQVAKEPGPSETQVWTDAGSVNSQSLATAYVPVAGDHGWGRVRRINILGRCTSPCNLRVSAAYDYNNSTQAVIQNAIAVTAGQFHFRVRTLRQLCQAISVRLDVTPTSGTFAGLTISSIELETSVKSGALRKPDTASY